MKIYDFKVKDNLGNEISLENYKGKTLIIVNTASKCGLTPQFEDLEFLYKKYKNENFEILGFPCNQFAKQELNSNNEIQEFCQLNYGVTFKVFDKINVNGKNAHPLYKYLKKEKSGIFGGSIKWNFTKFLIDKNGNVVERYAPTDSPLKMEEKIKELIK
mgnify:FL=1